MSFGMTRSLIGLLSDFQNDDNDFDGGSGCCHCGGTFDGRGTATNVLRFCKVVRSVVEDEDRVLLLSPLLFVLSFVFCCLTLENRTIVDDVIGVNRRLWSIVSLAVTFD